MDEVYMELVQLQQNINDMADDDYQYFQWLSDAEFQAELEKVEKELHKKYGWGTTYILKYSEFLKQNNIK